MDRTGIEGNRGSRSVDDENSFHVNLPSTIAQDLRFAHTDKSEVGILGY
jgi:hypothetical protein